jgi:hypothetical protein
LGRGLEEITREVTCYIVQLKNIMPAAREEATRQAVQEWTNCGEHGGCPGTASCYRGGLGATTTQSGRSELDCNIATLEKRRGNLVVAMKSGRQPSVDSAARILEGALIEALAALQVIARVENWPWERTHDWVQSLHDPVNLMIKTATVPGGTRPWKPRRPR